MSQEPERQPDQEPEHLQHAAEHEKPGKSNHVMNYLVILFAAAFLLMLLSYFMQQRTNQEAMEGLKQSVSTMSSWTEVVAQNEALEEQVADLERQLADAQAALTETQQQAGDLQGKLADSRETIYAMDKLLELQQLYDAKQYKAARALLETFDGSYLPEEPLGNAEDGELLSPAQRYANVKEALS